LEVSDENVLPSCLGSAVGHREGHPFSHQQYPKVYPKRSRGLVFSDDEHGILVIG